MQCREVCELADSFLSEELLTETNHAILRHLERCGACRAEVESRRALRRALRGAFDRAPHLQASRQFLDSLPLTLRQGIAEPGRRRWTRAIGWWALAAAIVLAVAGTGAIWQWRWVAVVGELARAAVGDHRYCAPQFRLAERPIALREATARYGVDYRAFEHVPADDIMTDAGPAHVVARHVCVYDGRRFVHIVMTYQGERVSLLVPAVGEGLPLAVRVERERRVTALGLIDEFSTASWRSSDRLMFVVGAVPERDLVALAEALSGSFSS